MRGIQYLVGPHHAFLSERGLRSRHIMTAAQSLKRWDDRKVLFVYRDDTLLFTLNFDQLWKCWLERWVKGRRVQGSQNFYDKLGLLVRLKLRKLS